MKSIFSSLGIKCSIAITTLIIGVTALGAGVFDVKPTSPQPKSADGISLMRTVKDTRLGKLPYFNLLDASVTTDKQDYSPGEIVNITGSGFYPGEQVALQVTYITTFAKTKSSLSLADASGHAPWTVIADSSGNISSSWLVESDSLGQTLLLTADGQTSGLHAEHVFTDNVGNDFKQCANDSGANPLGRCDWINSILQQSNSRYFEGMSTLQRLIFNGIPGTTGNNHVLGFHDDFTKGGIHAYDFLTSWEQAIQAGEDNGVPYLDLQSYTPIAGEKPSIDQTLTKARACGTAISATALTVCNAVDLSTTNHIDVALPGDAFISHDGLTQQRINGYEAVYGTRYLRIFGDAPFTAASITLAHDVADNGDTADSVINYQLHWTSASQNVVIVWGEHIALGGDGTGIGWGPGKGASSISGGPYHVSLDSLDGTLGSEDNQLKGADVLPPPPQGSITIVKDAVPNDAQDFGFTTTGGLTPATFSLDDDGDPTLSNSQQFAGLANGTYTVTETGGVAGWKLAKLVCTDPNGGTTTNLATGTASINLSAGEAVTCTFTNVKPDAKIVLTPGTATNEVGHAHTITATVSQDDMIPSGAPGDNADGFGPAPDGTLVTFSLPGGGASFVGGVNTCTTTGGTCSVSINSTSAGSVTIHATTTFSVQGISLTRASGDGLSGDSSDAKKTYVDAKISLSPPSATNEVGHAHTITATVQQDDGLVAGAPGDAVTGFGPAPNGTVVTFSISSGSATFVGGVNTCSTTGGTCSVQINSTGAGVNTIHATTTFSVGGLSLTRATGDGLSGDGSNVTKTYVDARIVLSPLTATNNVNVNHVITATVSQDDGIAAGAPGDAVTGFGPAPNGTTVSFSITNSAGATATFVGPSSCTTTSGACTVTIVSPTAGHVVIHATTTFSVGGVSLTRASGDSHTGDSVDAQKDYVSGSLTLVKRIVNDNGGTAVVGAFGITTSAGTPVNFGAGAADGANTLKYTSNTFSNLAPGSFTLHEGTLTGYSEGTWSCTGAAATANGDPQNGSIVIAANENVVCTITNNDNPPSLILDKIVVNDNGGTALESDFTLTANGGAAGTLTGPGAAGHTDVSSGAGFKAGTYALSESGPSGYTSSGYSCVKNGGAPAAATSITLGLGDSAVCTVTNNDNPPSLILDKIVVNDNGGTALESDFTLTANGGAAGTLTGPGAAGHTDVSSGAGFKAGTYALSESGPSGYTSSGYSCVKNGGAPAAATSITLGLGDSAVCTITNNDNPPSLILDKIVVNDNGGTALESDFTLTANGGGAGTLTGPGAAGHTDVSSGAGFKAGTYALSESGPSGYTSSGYSCVKNGGAPAAATSITLGLGDSAVCTITNNDNPPSLILDKIVVNDNGGTALESDFTLTANGGAAGTLTGPGAVGHTDVSSGAGFKAGTYALSESGPSGYTSSGYSCVKNGGAPAAATSITLGLGDSAVCTITNNDNPPSLILDKIVVNDNGGTALESDFTLTANGGGAGTLTGPGAAGHTDVSSGAGFKAGTYALSESGPSGYTSSGYSCVKNGGAPAAATSITLGLGDSAVCTITNNDNPPSLILDKIVVNDNGGTALESDFTLTANGGGAGTLTGPGAAGHTDVSSGAGFKAGTYALSESGPSGYTSSGYSCVKNGGAPAAATSITLGLGDSAVCTITNNDIGPSLTIVKKIVNDNGGTAVVGDFGLSTNAGGLIFGAGVPVGSTTTYTSHTITGLSAGVAYSLHEGTLGGYTDGTWSCDVATPTNNSAGGGSVMLPLGVSVTCTITNDDQPGTIIIRKITDPLNDPTTFSFDASGPLPSGTDYQDFSLTGVSTGTPPPNENSQTLNAGNYSVKEINIPANWVLTGVGTPGGTGCEVLVAGAGGSSGAGDLPNATATITLTVGATVRCTFEDTHVGGTTRTQGFWATHTTLANYAWFGGTDPVTGHVFLGVANTPGIGDTLLCGRSIATLPELMGGFWGDIPKDCNGGRRSKLDQSRMQLLQQLLAAELNASAFGSTPSQGSFSAWETAFCTGVNIQTALSQAATFNTSGDNGIFTPGTSADAKNAKTIADTCFWNLPAGAIPIEPTEDKTILPTKLVIPTKQISLLDQ